MSSSVTLIANGPSANKVIENKRYLRGQDIMVLNNFACSEYFHKIKPRYYILMDPAFFRNDNKVENEVGNNDSSLFAKLNVHFQEVDWDMTLFVPYSKHNIKYISHYINNKRIKIRCFHNTRVLGFDSFQNRMYKINAGIPSTKNVIIPAIIQMINIGYKTIYLYGCEFSWTKTMDVDKVSGLMYFNDCHFYSNSKIRYFNKGGYKWWLSCIVDMLNGTEQVAKYASSVNSKIINRTPSSFIDSFDYEYISEIYE